MVKIVKTTASFRQTQKMKSVQSSGITNQILSFHGYEMRAQQPKKQVMLKNNAGKHFHE